MYRLSRACCALLLSLVAPLATAAVTQAAPWELKTPAGDTVRYPQDAQGQPTVLLFWPTWCPFSRALQPYVQAIWEDYRDRGVKLWTINILEQGGDPLQAIKERGLSFPLLLDGDGLIGPYGIRGTPWFVVIDGDGRIVYTRPADAPAPIDVARAARETLNRLLGDRAVPLPTLYPKPYDLHLRQGTQISRLESTAAGDAEWLPWAARYLDALPAQEARSEPPPQGPVASGKAAIAIARQLWTAAWGEDAVAQQAPYRAYRQGDRWLVAGTARPGRLGEGYVLVIGGGDGRVLRMAQRGRP